jgi:hypothetical protein
VHPLDACQQARQIRRIKIMRVDRHIAVSAGWIGGPAFGVAMMATPEYLHPSGIFAALLFWGGLGVFFVTLLVVFIASTLERQAGTRRLGPLILMAFGLAVFGAGVAWYFWPSSPHVEVAGNNIIPSELSGGASPVLHRHYVGADRERLSELLFTMYNYIDKNISPQQLDVHRLSSGPGTTQTVARLSDLRDKLKVARTYLGDFSQTNTYYQNEIEDVLGNRDLLYADMVAIDNYIDLVSAVSADPQDRAAKLIAPAIQRLHEANVDLGTWISQCVTRIKAKRDALQ